MEWDETREALAPDPTPPQYEADRLELGAWVAACLYYGPAEPAEVIA
jgi:hypothetical protein